MSHTFHFKKYFIFIILGFIILYFFAITPRLSKINELAPINTYAYAHRGLYNNDASIPENSLPAFKAAIASGYGIELDVQLTKDKVAVVHHDLDLLRSCNVNQKIADLTYEELQTYNLFGSQETIPQFEDVLSLINGQVPVLVELKVELDYKETCEITAQILDSYNGLYTIQSFSPYALKWFKENQPDILRGQLARNFFKGEPSGYNGFTNFVLSHLLLNFLTKPDYIAYAYEDINEPSLNICHLLFKTPIIGWTFASQEDYLTYEHQWNTVIFEHFLPPIS